MRTIIHLLILVLVVPSICAQTPSSPPDKLEAGLRRDVFKLASKEMMGRGAERRADVTAWLAKRFAEIGLEPPRGGYLAGFKRAAWGKLLSGTNVVGILRGTDPTLSKRHVVLGAHWDHLGQRKDQIHPGACDNASGVAALLAAARAMKADPPKRTVVFVAYDLEEVGLVGSFAYVDAPALPIEQCDFSVTIDMLGRSGMGLLEGWAFAVGWEWTPGVISVVKEAAASTGVTPGMFWSDVVGDRSDFVAYREKRIPHLFFSTGENPDYHQPTDTADRIDYGQLAKQTRLVTEVTARIANRAERFTYRRFRLRHVIEFESLRDIAVDMLKIKGPMITAELRKQFHQLRGFAAAAVARGSIRPADRRVLLKATKQLQSSMR